MTKTFTTFAALLTWSALTTPAMAFTGNELTAKCKSTEPMDLGFCFGFLEAISVSAVTCIPKGVTRGQARDVFLKFAASVPESTHLDAVLIAQLAMENAFPCAKPR